MKPFAAILFVAWGVSPPAQATTPQQGTPQCRLLDQILAVAKSHPQAKQVILGVLEQIAEARVNDSARDLEVQVGLKPGDLRAPSFQSEPVRAYALSLIAEIDLPEALTYLQNFKRNNAPVGGPMMVWPAARIALHQALLNRIPEEPARVKFLENALNEQHDTWSDDRVSAWALNELCNRGSMDSLETIRTSVLKRDSTHGQREIELCQERMEVISRNADRVKALGSFLSISSGFADKELLGWAINQLAALRSTAADAELKHFANEVDSLPENSPLREHLRPAQHDARDAPDRQR